MTPVTDIFWFVQELPGKLVIVMAKVLPDRVPDPEPLDPALKEIVLPLMVTVAGIEVLVPQFPDVQFGYTVTV